MLVKIESKFVEGKEFLKTLIFSKPLIHLWSKKGGWMNDSIHECWINQKVRIKEKYNVNKNTRKFKMREEFLRGRRKEGKYIIDWYPFVVNILILQNMNTVKCYLLAYKVLKKKSPSPWDSWCKPRFSLVLSHHPWVQIHSSVTPHQTTKQLSALVWGNSNQRMECPLNKGELNIYSKKHLKQLTSRA